MSDYVADLSDALNRLDNWVTTPDAKYPDEMETIELVGQIFEEFETYLFQKVATRHLQPLAKIACELLENVCNELNLHVGVYTEVVKTLTASESEQQKWLDSFILDELRQMTRDPENWDSDADAFCCFDDFFDEDF